jgi:hypothetical protein
VTSKEGRAVEHDIQDASLERFAAGTASREEALAITRHLLRECPICAERLRSLLQPSIEAADYGPALEAFERLCLGPPKEPEKGPPPSKPKPSTRKLPRPRPWK